MILGNDLAVYQEAVSFDQYKDNANFVIAKATEGNGFTDTRFIRNRDEARRVGMPLGFYHFARPDLGNAPEVEAGYFLSVIGELRDGEVLALDYECPNQVQAHVDWCLKFLGYCFDKTGVRPLIYLNQAQVQKFDWKKVVDFGSGLWIAAYLKTTAEPFYSPKHNDFNKGQWPFAAMQQWTNAQEVPGIPKKADGDVFFGDVATFKKYGYKKPATPPAQPQITDETVIPGIENKKVKDILSELLELRTYKAQAGSTINDLKTRLKNINVMSNIDL